MKRAKPDSRTARGAPSGPAPREPAPVKSLGAGLAARMRSARPRAGRDAGPVKVPGSGKDRSRSGRRAAPSRREMLALRPVRNPRLEWTEEDGHVVLYIKRARNWKTRVLNLFFPLPEDRRVVLDPIGTDVWRMLDGQITIAHIARTLAGKYKLSSREAELSLQQFFKELSRRGYVAFWVEQPEPAEGGR